MRSPGPERAHRAAGGPLRERLADVEADRSATAEDMVVETAAIALGWVLEQSPEWSWEDAGAELEEGLARWIRSQAWRGPAALFLDTLRSTWHWAATDGPASPRDVLAAELGFWVAGCDPDPRDAGGPEVAWEGRPLGPGVRMPRRSDLARHAAAELESDETILVPAFSETVARALEAARTAGRAPHVVVPEGAPGRDGRTMAQRSIRAGLGVSYVYDAALPSVLPRVDRVWLGTEAIGSAGFLGHVGTRILLEEALRRDVPATVLATSDKLVPGGALELPSWCEEAVGLLWEDAPHGVQLEPQAYERVPQDLAAGLLTEMGPETAADLSLRRLRVEAAPPCGAMRRGGDLAPRVLPERGSRRNALMDIDGT